MPFLARLIWRARNGIQKYSELKRELAQTYPEDIQGYMKGKNGLIREVEKTALEWQNLKLIYSNWATLTNES